MTSDTAGNEFDLSPDLIRALSELRGWRIALIAPAGGISDARIEAITRLLVAAGITPLPGRHIHAHHRYLAGTRDQRLADLHEAFETPAIDAVWCLRGGYGSAQLIDGIEWDRINADRPLIGHSDITALACAFAANDKTAIHGPVAADLIRAWSTDERDLFAESVAHLADALKEQPSTPALTRVAGPGNERPTRLWGGNLTVLASIADLDLRPPGRRSLMLLLEDVGEAAFRLERCFHQVARSPLFAHTTAIALGHFRDCGIDRDLFLDIMSDHIDLQRVDIWVDAPMGHGARNHAWRYG